VSFNSGLAEISARVDSPPVRKGHAGWRYWDRAEVPDGEWMLPTFEDGEWSQGEAPLGYGEDVIKTKTSFGGDPENKHPAGYFRLTFEVNDPNAFPAWLAEIRCDDGAVLYLNGKEVYHYKIQEGDLSRARFSAGKLSSSGNSETRYHPFHLKPNELLRGSNVLTVSVHQADAGSSDLVIDVSIEGLVGDRLAPPPQRSLLVDGVLDADNAISSYINGWGKQLLMQDRSPAPNQWEQQLERRLFHESISKLPIPTEPLSTKALFMSVVRRVC
jgi:hypothetical protein